MDQLENRSWDGTGTVGDADLMVSYHGKRTEPVDDVALEALPLILEFDGCHDILGTGGTAADHERDPAPFKVLDFDGWDYSDIEHVMLQSDTLVEVANVDLFGVGESPVLLEGAGFKLIVHFEEIRHATSRACGPGSSF